jgi:hypothetical protein
MVNPMTTDVNTKMAQGQGPAARLYREERSPRRPTSLLLYEELPDPSSVGREENRVRLCWGDPIWTIKEEILHCIA